MSEHVTVWVDDLPDLKRGEEIVRCRDCKYFNQRDGIFPPMVCERWGYYNFKTEPGGFLQFDMFRITPEQAITATLGRGTCEMHRYKNALGYIDEWQCSECGADVSGIADDTPPNYCPSCGAKVVER